MSDDMQKAADEALALLAAEKDREDTERLRRAIPQSVKDHFQGYRVTVAIGQGDAIGIAIMSPKGIAASVSGSKIDCLADFDGWLAARYAEIEAKLKVAK